MEVTETDPVSTTGHTFVIGVGNQKGGVAKTTNTVNLAASLAELGRTVLLMDCDTNCGVTRALGIPPGDFPGTYEVMLGDEKPEDLYLANGDSDLTLPANLFVIPGSRQMNDILDELARRHTSKFSTPPNKAELLRTPVQNLAAMKMFDYIFLDTGPQTPPPTLSTYMAVDYFLLSAFPERDAIEGLEDALQDLADARASGNPRLSLLGVISSAVDRRTKLAKKLASYLTKKFTNKETGESGKLEPSIPSSVVVKNAREECLTVLDYAPKHQVAAAYRELAKSIDARLLAKAETAEAAAAGQGVANA